MISLFGNISLLFALFFALMQSTVPFYGFYRKNAHALAFARPSALGQFIFVLGAYALLTIAFVTNDFTIAYVAENSHATLPFLYRLTAIWGSHEGSILLWILMLNIWTLIFSVTQKNNKALPLVLAVLGVISFCFLCFLFLTSNPFLITEITKSGNDLNPLLQDPGFIIHPPMLYAGYVGFSVAFAITEAALLRGKLDAEWARTARQFALAAWCFLTFGIALGSWWAYRVLGWGGFWFWDPVENASLLPWLAGTALIHVLNLAEKRDIAKGFASLLGITCFALSLLGTFLVRSGVLISAHTFSNDPARGVFLLALLAFVTTLALFIHVTRAPKIIGSSNFSFSRTSREMALLINGGLLLVAMLTILLGTLYPLIIDALQLGALSVGAPYFNTVMLPIVFIIMVFMGFAPYCDWQTRFAKKSWQPMLKNMFGSVVIAALLLWYFTNHFDLTVLISLTLSIWILLGIFHAFRYAPGMSLAHMGFAILIIGIMLSSLLNQEREVRLQPGNSTKVGPYQFLFVDTTGVSGSNYRGIRADFEVTKGERHITMLYPEKRIYTVRDMVMTKVDIHPGIFRDLYIALGEPIDKDVWSVRIYYKPFIRWIWFGGLIMIIGGFFAILRPRFSTGK